MSSGLPGIAETLGQPSQSAVGHDAKSHTKRVIRWTIVAASPVRRPWLNCMRMRGSIMAAGFSASQAPIAQTGLTTTDFQKLAQQPVAAQNSAPPTTIERNRAIGSDMLDIR